MALNTRRRSRARCRCRAPKAATSAATFTRRRSAYVRSRATYAGPRWTSECGVFRVTHGCASTPSSDIRALGSTVNILQNQMSRVPNHRILRRSLARTVVQGPWQNRSQSPTPRRGTERSRRRSKQRAWAGGRRGKGGSRRGECREELREPRHRKQEYSCRSRLAGWWRGEGGRT